MEQLKDKPVEVQEIEKIPAEVEKELKQLREKQNLGEAAGNFKIRFNIIQNDFNEIFRTLESMPDDVQKKYKKALVVLVEKMEERLK